MGSRRTTKTIIHIDSRDRDKVAYPKAWEYRMNFNDLGLPVCKNVYSIELLSCTFPKVANEDYVFLHLDEINGRVHSSNAYAHEPFALVYGELSNGPVGSTKPAKGADFFKKILTFTPPLASLGYLTVRFTKHGSDIVDADIRGVAAGTLDGSTDQLEVGRNNLLFEITTIDDYV